MIEKGIPIPPSRRTLKHKCFAEMQVGDSVLMDKKYNQAGAITTAKKSGKGAKFTTRKMEDGRIRVWRIA